MTPPATVPPLMLTVEQAAKEIGMGVGRFYEELINTGEVPTVKIGHRRRVRYADLAKWAAELPADSPAASPA